MVISVVDLPAPFAPIRVTISPCADLEADVGERRDRAVPGRDLAQLEQGRRLPRGSPRYALMTAGSA